MKKLIIVLGICLLGFGCDKVENDDDQIRQNEINRQFIGLWKYAVPHDKNTEPYYGPPLENRGSGEIVQISLE